MSRWIWVVLVGCSGVVSDPGGSRPDLDPTRPDGPPSPVAGIDPAERPLRPLNRRELVHTLGDLLGVEVHGIADSIPLDSRELVYDRMGAAQTVGALHVEGHLAMADAVAEAALADDAIIGRLMPGCDVAALGPRERPNSDSTVGSSLTSVDEEWRLCFANDDWGGSNRCPEVTDPTEVRLQFTGSGARLTQSVGSDGLYRVDVLASGVGSSASVRVEVDGALTTTLALTPSSTGASRTFDTYGIDVALTAGDRRIDFISQSGTVYLRNVTVAGPTDDRATADAPARDACAAAFVSSFAPRAWRRPLDADESAEVARLFAAGRADGFFFDGLRMALAYVLGAPEHLYHVEIGTPTGAPNAFRLTDHELASRLSYLAWESMPDDALFSAAERGELRTPEQIRAHADRLFASPRAHETVMRFYEQWLDLDALDSLTKDTMLFPEFTNAVRAAMGEETRTFLSEMTWNAGADMVALLTEQRTWLPPDLASIYGLAAPSATSEVALPPERIGLLTQPSVLAIHGKPNSHSPVRRGVFVLERILCEELPLPPPDVDFAAVDRSTAPTTRERYAEHSANEACSGCHEQIDPIGFTFEGYDTLGRFRTHENGIPVDATGGVPQLGIENGELDGAVELATAIAATDSPNACLARQWLRFGLGRYEDETDATSIDALRAGLDTDGIRGMLVALTTTDAFVHRLTVEEAGR